MYFFFDTETNGLPKNWGASAEDVDNWPRVTQLCFAVFDKDGQLKHSFNSYIIPDGWTIPNEKFFIDNGMTDERCREQGIPIADAMEQFIAHRLENDHTIAHNIAFDGKIMRAEMFRLNRKEEFTAKKTCTMKASTNYCALTGPRGYKWPKLEELHMKLFGCKFEGAHDAMNDVMATAKCFFELKRRGVITLE